MKLIITIVAFLMMSNYTTMAIENDCNQYEKLSKEYTKCNSLLLKKKSKEVKETASKKSNEIKDKASKKINKVREKFSKFDLKKKLLKFKNSKSHKEYKEN
tara:strand:- start:944 stop:1246 length:303 start_codon:yes stop_codon:yes gene_type:complete